MPHVALRIGEPHDAALEAAAAMVERQRKDFHVEFTTLRFTCIGEYGAWEGRSSIVPTLARAPHGPHARGITCS